MVKTPAKDNPQAKQKSATAMVRCYEPEEFDADTNEERAIAVLAERRRQFLSMLNTREPQSDQ